MMIHNLSFFLFFYCAITAPLAAGEQTLPTLYPHDTIENGFISVVLEENEIIAAHNNLKTCHDAKRNVVTCAFDATYRYGIFPEPDMKQKYDHARAIYNQAAQLLEYVYPIPENTDPRHFYVPAASWPLLCDSLPDSFATDTKKTFYKTIADNLAPKPRNLTLDWVHFDHYLKNTKDEKPLIFTVNDVVNVIRSFLYPFTSVATFHSLESRGDCMYATSRCGGLVPHVEKDTNARQMSLASVEPRDGENAFFKTKLCNNGSIKIKTDDITIETGLCCYVPSVDHIDYSLKNIAACITVHEKLYVISSPPNLSNKYIIEPDKNNPNIPIVTAQKQAHVFEKGISFRKNRLDETLLKHVTLLTMHPNKNYCIIQRQSSFLGYPIYGSNCLFKAKWSPDQNTKDIANTNISLYARNTNFKKLLFITDNTLIGLSNDGKLFIGYVPKDSELCTFVPQKHPGLIFENMATEYGSTVSSSCVALLSKCGKVFCALPFGGRDKKGNIILYRQAQEHQEKRGYEFVSVQNMYLENLHIITASLYCQFSKSRWCSNIVPSFGTQKEYHEAMSGADK